MSQDFDQYVQRFNALTPREKLMATSTTLLLVWAVWDNLLYQPLSKQAKTLHDEISALESNVSTQRLLAEQLKHIDRTSPAQVQLSQLQGSVDRLKLQLDAGEKKFVPAELMATALRDILQQHGNLQLLKLETKPATPFGNDEKQAAWVYKHTLELTVQGDFFSTLDYLKALEALPWRVHWDSIDYKVDHYPTAATRIQVYTLSFEKDWLGV